MAEFMTPEEAAEEKYGVGIYFGQDIDKQVSIPTPDAESFLRASCASRRCGFV